ncbi:MAG: 4a-hydroxytetrahydrobiopterin dehydratase [Simkaniaceae bacterium]|jgi:4a-hydroxytetrahydrobiopterin dehydratase
MKDLVEKKCTPCVVGSVALKGEALKPLYMQLGEGWAIKEEHHLEKTYSFKNFKQALAFTNIVGHVAEEEGHHPDLFLSWGKVILKIWTHKVNGLTESDFILAAKIEAEYISHQG